MHIKTTMRYHLTPVRIAFINKSTQNKLTRTWRKGNPFALFMGMETGAATMESRMDLPFDPVIPLLGIYSQKSKTPTQRT